MANLFIDEEFLNNMANAIIKQNKAHGTIDDYIISNEGLNPQQFADAIRHLDVAPLKQRPIITADFGTTNHIGTIEYKPADADCWGSITVNVSEEERLNTLNALTSQSFATISDDDLVRVIDAMDMGIITPEQTGWQIGDERLVQLSAMEAMNPLTDTHEAQTAILAIMDSGHYNLTTPTISGRTKDHFVIGLKTVLKERGSLAIDRTQVTSWNNIARRTWCNTIFKNAFPQKLQSIFKSFEVITVVDNNNFNITNDYFSLFAETEVLGLPKYAYTYENELLKQITYYINSNNISKPVYENNISPIWWTRSIDKDNNKYYCTIRSGLKKSDYEAGHGMYYLAPFGCI